MRGKEIILASASRRRSEILKSCGIKHRVLPSKIKEDFKLTKDARRIVILNARRKAKAASRKAKNAIVIGADTLVRAKGHLLGKPVNKREAEEFLRLFSGRRISVYTGLCLIDAATGKSAEGCEVSELKVKSLSNTEIKRYLRFLRPYDKAGGFSIEGPGAIIFDDIKGSFFNILGLPMNKLAELLKKLDIEITDLIEIP